MNAEPFCPLRKQPAGAQVGWRAWLVFPHFWQEDPTTVLPGAWRISSERIGIPYTGLDALMRHFNEHPEDRPLLATPQGVDLINEILAAARTTPDLQPGPHDP